MPVRAEQGQPVLRKNGGSTITSDSLRHESAARLRQAVASEAYEDVKAALAEYRAQVEAALINLPPNSAPPADLARETAELMKWALQVLRTARTRHSDQLDSISAALRYAYTLLPSGTLKVDI